MEEKTTLYHVNTHEKIDNLLQSENLIISKHEADRKYAGYGMYFWDNRGNAKYWFNQKLRYERKSNLSLLIVSVSYNSDELLDLMDLEQEQLYMEIIQKMKESGQFKSKYLGDKIDFLCKLLNCKIVRVNANYPGTPATGLLSGSFVTNKNKVIYCIKESHYDIIKSKHKEVFS